MFGDSKLYLSRMTRARPREILASLGDMTRWTEWSQSKTPALAGGIFVALSSSGPMPLGQFVAWFLASTGILAFGYAINELSDREIDKLAGKPNAFADLTSVQAALSIVGISAISLLPLLLLFRETASTVLIVAGVVLAAAYSLPPVRLKERGWFGIVAAGIAQRAIPLAAGLALLTVPHLVSFALIALFSIVGIRWMLLHQLVDSECDRKSGLSTIVSSKGEDAVISWFVRILIPAEISLILILLLYPSDNLLLARLALVPIYGFWLLAKWWLYSERYRIFNLRAFWMHPLADLYEVVLPIWFGCVVVSVHPAITPILVVLLMWLLPFWWRRTASLRGG